jgi:3-oxoacid CoA-transferase subunit A
MIYITGDIHGEILRIANMIERYQLTIDDTIVILGDVGMNYYGNKRGDRRRKKS